MKSKQEEAGLFFRLRLEISPAQEHRTSLIFATKHFKGYEIMKDIMAGESSTLDQGVPSFMYSPADASMPLLFSLSQPFSKLRHGVMSMFVGKELCLDDIYKRHSVDTPYIRTNYRDVVLALEKDGGVSVRSIKGKRKPGTFPEHVLIKFPKGGSHGDENVDRVD